MQILAQGGPVGSLDETTDIHALRETLRKRKLELTASAGPSDSSITETDHQIKTRDGSEITVRVYKGPESANGPVMMMFHGGGWVLGGLDNEALLCRKFCTELGGVSVNVDYRLAPEFKFPTAVYDCYDAVKWTAANASIHGGDLSKGFIVGGVSAGANLACSSAHLARDENLSPKITGAYLSIPSVLAPQAVPAKWKDSYLSREENKNALVLNEGAIALFHSFPCVGLYEDDPTSHLMSVVNWPSGHENTAPTYFQVCGMDPLRDEGLIYEKILREEAKVPTKMDLYPGLPHGFWSWWPKAGFTQKQQSDSIQGLRWLLDQH
ncbi:alpha/beta-hydrolase [Thozetella sp. PMI_491]|nr:alpha/beta-hydrolase [Thozetella sp. PMI_491]